MGPAATPLLRFLLPRRVAFRRPLLQPVGAVVLATSSGSVAGLALALFPCPCPGCLGGRVEVSTALASRRLCDRVLMLSDGPHSCHQRWRPNARTHTCVWMCVWMCVDVCVQRPRFRMCGHIDTCSLKKKKGGGLRLTVCCRLCVPTDLEKAAIVQVLKHKHVAEDVEHGVVTNNSMQGTPCLALDGVVKRVGEHRL